MWYLYIFFAPIEQMLHFYLSPKVQYFLSTSSDYCGFGVHRFFRKLYIKAYPFKNIARNSQNLYVKLLFVIIFHVKAYFGNL